MTNKTDTDNDKTFAQNFRLGFELAKKDVKEEEKKEKLEKEKEPKK